MAGEVLRILFRRPRLAGIRLFNGISDSVSGHGKPATSSPHVLHMKWHLSGLQHPNNGMLGAPKIYNVN